MEYLINDVDFDNPVDTSTLEAPFSADAAAWLYSLYRIRQNPSFSINAKQ